MKKLILLALCASVPAACQSIIAGQDDTHTTRVVRTDNQGQVYIANPGSGGSTTISGGQASTGDPITSNPVTVAGSNGANTTVLRTDAGGAIATTQITAGVDGFSNANLAQAANTGGSHSAVQVAPLVFNGSTWDRKFVCPSSAVVSVTNGTTGQLVALTASQVIRVCSIVLTSTAATTATLSYGTGTTCGTGNNALTGAMALGASTAPLTISLGSDGALRTAASNALCLAAGATTVTGFITYAKY